MGEIEIPKQQDYPSFLSSKSWFGWVNLNKLIGLIKKKKSTEDSYPNKNLVPNFFFSANLDLVSQDSINSANTQQQAGRFGQNAVLKKKMAQSFYSILSELD